MYNTVKSIIVNNVPKTKLNEQYKFTLGYQDDTLYSLTGTPADGWEVDYVAQFYFIGNTVKFVLKYYEEEVWNQTYTSTELEDLEDDMCAEWLAY